MKTARELSCYVGLLTLLLTFPVRADEASLPWFIGVSAGQAQFDTSLDVDQGNIDLLYEPEDDGDSYTAEFGYAFDPDWFVSVEYSFIDADDTEFQNYYLSLNYRRPLGRAGAAFIGVLAGQSNLAWEEAPIATVNRDKDSEQLLLGAQAGFSYDFSRHWRLMLRYQFLAPEHKTKLRPGTARAEFIHEQFHNVSLGIHFRF